MKRRLAAQAIRQMAVRIGLCAMLVSGTEGATHLTFLDTLNRGKEVCITDADLSVLRPVSLMEAASGSERQREYGVVPSRFKIQLFAAQTEDEVQIVKKELEGKIDLPVTIVFETPLFKLFAGDFSSKDTAEKYVAKLREMGYGDAWVVRKAVAQH
jgi:hypothetical protein